MTLSQGQSQVQGCEAVRMAALSAYSTLCTHGPVLFGLLSISQG